MLDQYNMGGVLVLGAGELGLSVLQELALLRKQKHVPPVSVLLRPPARTSSGTAAIFSRFTQVVCWTGFIGGPSTQRKIKAAVIAAGVAYYVPWQFGVDYDVIGRGSGQEVWDKQLDVRDMLRTQSQVHWAIVSTGMFTSFVFLPAFGLADL